MGVNYTAKVAIGVLLTDEEAKAYEEWFEANDCPWNVEYLVIDAGDYYGGGTQKIVGVVVATTDWGWEQVWTDSAGAWSDAKENVRLFSERTGILLDTDRIAPYVGLLIH